MVSECANEHPLARSDAPVLERIALRTEQFLKTVVAKVKGSIERQVKSGIQVQPQAVKSRETFDCSPPKAQSAVAKRALKKWNERREEWRDMPAIKLNFQDEVQRRDFFYAKGIKSLADRVGAQVVFVAMVKSNTPPLAQADLKGFEDLVGAPLISPPLGLLENLHDYKGYIDPTHLNLNGSQLLTQWLNEELRRRGIFL